MGKGHSFNGPRHSHTRSHSRNASISAPPLSSSNLSSSLTLPPTESLTKHDLSHFSFPPSDGTLSPLSRADQTAVPKRNSHHRRRSSVSTRHESAELMGMTLPDLPPSASEDNINLGEKDSIRRRALWALEGKPDVSYNKVEIPELSTPVIEKMMFDFCKLAYYFLFW
jgi:hypothetical protein